MTTITVTAPGGATSIAAVNPLTAVTSANGENVKEADEEDAYEYDLETTV